MSQQSKMYPLFSGKPSWSSAALLRVVFTCVLGDLIRWWVDSSSASGQSCIGKNLHTLYMQINWYIISFSENHISYLEPEFDEVTV